MISAWAGDLLDLLFPPLCPVCGDNAETAGRAAAVRRAPLCEGCWESIRWLRPPWCAVCGNPLPPCGHPDATGLCGTCLARPPLFTYARSGARYEGPLRDALHAFKFSRKTALAGPLSAVLLDACRDALPRPVDIVVPVPLHRARERERGFNQASLLAGRVAQALGATLDERALRRIRATATQADLSGAERRANVRGAFALGEDERLRGRHVVVVDDVLTTGATVRECARALRTGGIASVGILTVARVV